MTFDAVLVSITEICTVGCRHCGFRGTPRNREAGVADLAAWVSQVCDYGIRRIICTGGEPFQRFEVLRAAVAAAVQHPAAPAVGVFTSGAWGSTPQRVDRLLSQLPGLSHLYVSSDIYHQERIPAAYVHNVIDGALAHGVPLISICITVASDDEERRTRDLFERFANRVMFHVGRVIPTPFLAGIAPAGHPPDPPRYQPACYLNTPLINPNGDVAACHIGKAGAYVDLAETAYFLGSLATETFDEIMRRAERNYEYQFLRAFGPRGIARVVLESDALRARFADCRFTTGCDLCYKVLRPADARAHFRALVETPAQRALIDAARVVRYGRQAGVERPVYAW